MLWYNHNQSSYSGSPCTVDTCVYLHVIRLLVHISEPVLLTCMFWSAFDHHTATATTSIALSIGSWRIHKTQQHACIRTGLYTETRNSASSQRLATARSCFTKAFNISIPVVVVVVCCWWKHTFLHPPTRFRTNRFHAVFVPHRTYAAGLLILIILNYGHSL